MKSQKKHVDSQPTGLDEKAQYEVFKNGSLPREVIQKWFQQDIKAVASIAHLILSESSISDKIVDVLYERYRALHP